MAPPLKFKLFFFLLLVTNCFAQPMDYVRVQIIQDAKSVSIKAAGSYEINDAGNRVLYRGRDLKTTATVFKGKVLLSNVYVGPNKVIISVSQPGEIIVNGRKFRGSIQFMINDNDSFSVINHIGLEDYIKGILYHEVSHYWPEEALKAQAIVCRTYAVYQMRQNKNKDFDLTSDIYSQVYGGSTSERYRTNKAVRETEARVLVYRGKVFPAYFHATCGGHTEDASALWNIDIVPLKGVPCNFCKNSPHFDWHYVSSLGELKDSLTKAGYNVGDINDILILGKDKTGRNRELKIISPKKEIKISAKDFRNAVSPNLIKSTNFSVNLVNRDAVFEGFGWGHGVGLCQWGAYFMAKQGYKYGEILKYYYPGSDVKTIGF